MQRYCDRWWVAVSDGTIVREGELPPTWGLLVLQKDGRLVQRVEAPKLEPAPLTRAFLGSLLRNVTETTVPKRVFDARLRAQIKEHEKSGKDVNARRAEQAETALAELTEKVAAFEKASGVRIDRWTPGEKIGEAVQFVLRHKGAIGTGLTRARGEIANLLAIIDKVKGELVDQ